MNKIIHGDCLEKLKELEDNSVDSIVTDPPYHLVSIVKRFGKENSAPAKFGTDGAFARASKGFMGKDWDGLGEDGIGIANNKEMWAECLRVLKPGGYLLSFGGTRTYHRMASAIEDAGFEVRDMIEWVYGSGFPKSTNVSIRIDKEKGLMKDRGVGTSFARKDMGGGKILANGKEVEKHIGISEEAKYWSGWGTALKPAHEPICMARKPLAEKTVAENCLKWGTGGINIDESRVGTEIITQRLATVEGGKAIGGKGVGIKQKATGETTTTIGRFPANLIHDNSEEVRECFPETKSVQSKRGGATNGNGKNIDYGDFNEVEKYECGFNDSGNASRFFKSIIYQAKASKSERNKGCEGLEEKQYSYDGREKEIENPYQSNKSIATNNHPTVKPIALMEYLIKMVTPKGGVVLDPFAGSGSTLVAAKQNGYQYVGIEMTEEYIPIINARLGL